MADTSRIEWTDSTFNPWIGCTKVSPACDHCYAEAMMDTRMGRAKWGPGQPRVRTSAANWRKPLQWNAQPFLQCNCGWRGEKRDAQRSNGCPGCGGHYFNHTARRRVFCASLADVFDNEVDPQWRRSLFKLIAETPNLDWLLLTKRVGNVLRMLNEIADTPRPGSHAGDLIAHHWRNGTPPANVWMGATICNQAEADRDIPKLRAIPAAVRFVSIEPMLSDIQMSAHLGACNCYVPSLEGAGMHAPSCPATKPRVDWVIAGGESGPNARPSHPDWFRSLRDQCAATDVPFLFKQWGEWRPVSEGDSDWYDSLYRPNVVACEDQDQGQLDDVYGRRCTVPTAVIHVDGSVHDNLEPGAWQQGSGAMLTFKTGKKAAGRLLAGREHNGFPEARHA